MVIFSPEDLNSSVWCGRTGSKESSVTVLVRGKHFRAPFMFKCTRTNEFIHSIYCGPVA